MIACKMRTAVGGISPTLLLNCCRKDTKISIMFSGTNPSCLGSCFTSKGRRGHDNAIYFVILINHIPDICFRRLESSFLARRLLGFLVLAGVEQDALLHQAATGRHGFGDSETEPVELRVAFT